MKDQGSNLKLTGERIRQVLSKYKKHKASTNLVQAAVLVPLFYQGNELYLLFTQRSDKVTYHKGQISFPGGVHAPDDTTLLDTALRESYEEIGLEPKDVDILGELDDAVTLLTSFAISPFVALIPYPYPFRICTEEIDEILSIPLSVLCGKNNFRVEYEVIDNSVLPAYFYEYKGKVLWGATARIVNQLIELLFPGCGALQS